MRKNYCAFRLLLAVLVGIVMMPATAQTLNILPTVSPAGGTYEDNVTVACTFPEGCEGGIYWFNGGQIGAKPYSGPIKIESDTKLSVAGVNQNGKIITDIVTNEYIINKVTAPFVTTSPEVGSSRESFYVTSLTWNNASSTELDFSAFKEGGPRHGEAVVTLTNKTTGEVLCAGDYNSLWASGTNTYKAYVYKNYRPTDHGAYTLTIAGGVFIINGERYNEPLEFTYYIGSEEITTPVFSPEPGNYVGNVEVTITYPENAFYQFYQIGSGNRQNYNGPFTLTETATIKAWGRTEDWSEETPSATATYIVTENPDIIDELPMPRFSLNGKIMTITESDQTAVIKYWFDDDMNTAQFYTAPFEVTKNGKISAVAYRDHGLSSTADYRVNIFPDDADFGNIIIRTPEDWETLYLTGLSDNGRFVSGYTNAGGVPLGFVWDITSGKGEFISTNYNNQALGVSDDGTVFGWHMEIDPITGEASSTSDEDLFWGYFKDGEWTRQPLGMTVKGITHDNILYGERRGKPATYDIATGTLTVYPGGMGCINSISHDGSIIAGYLIIDEKKTPVYWPGNADSDAITIPADRACEVTRVSSNGNWMLLDNAEWGTYCDIAGYRVNRLSGEVETLVSMGARYPSRYEWMSCIADDGTLYGVYDTSLISHDAGRALAYTPDGIWRSVADILDEKGAEIEDLFLTSCKLVSADQNVYVMTVFPEDMSIDDAFNFAIAVRLNADMKHAAPVALSAKQMYGSKAVKLSWSAPLTGAENISGYKVLRNGSLIGSTTADETNYYDRDVENNTEYTYAVVALYNDGVESEPSIAETILVELAKHMPARNLTMRQSGINDVNLSWDSPIISLPKLQYFNSNSEFAAFGSAKYNSEWAIRIPASDLNIYEDLDIQTFQFLPTGPQAGYELRLYKGDTNSSNYDEVPFYTQTIDPASLNYGTVNTISLTTPQTLPLGNDLLVGLYIQEVGNDNMLGISHEGFRAGYTDLARIEGVHDRFVSIAETSSVTTEVVLPLGLGLGNEESLSSALVENYEISDNGIVVGTTDKIKFRIEDVTTDEHTFAVRAKFADGEYADPVTLTANIAANEKAFVNIETVNIDINGDQSVSLNWDAPLNEDKTDIHWGDLNPREGWINSDLPMYVAGSIYPVTLTSSYAEEYEITDLFYYPTCTGNFRVVLDNDLDTVFFDEEVTPQPNKLNYIKLDEPITIDQSTNYRLLVSVDNYPENTTPLAFDSSNSAKDGYSNMINIGMDWMTLTDILQIDDHASWLMGMVIRQKDAKPMPLEGYDVRIDDEKVNAEMLTDTHFTSGVLTEGGHKVAVDVVYDASRNVEGKNNWFVITTEGINATTSDSSINDIYDIAGRRIISDKQGRGIFIIGNKKYMNK